MKPINAKHYAGDLAQMQSLPLGAKIRMTQNRVRQWYDHFNGEVYVSFSGGKDSTVLLDIVRGLYPDIPAVYCDTGLEYPEIREFVKTVENVTWLYPIHYDRHKRKYVRTNFKEVIQTYGYPVASKETAKRIYELRHHNLCPEYRAKLMGETDDFPMKAVPKRWRFLVDAPFEVSSKCCDAMKKRPFHHYETETGQKPIVATMAEESTLRRSSWMLYGCNAFDKTTAPQSRPMSFWTEQDVLKYLTTYQIPYCPVYGEIVKTESGLKTTGCDRTGCMFCMFGCHHDQAPNRFQRMRETHPKQYAYCMKPMFEGGLGLDEVLTFIGVDH